MYDWLGLDARPTLSAEQRAAYDRHRAPGRTRVLLANVVTICGFYLSYALVDRLLLGDVTRLSIVLRFGLILPLAVALAFFLRSDQSIRLKEFAALSVSILGNIVWCVIMTSSDSPAALHYYYAAVIFQMVITMGVRPPFATALAASLVTFVINYAALPFVHGFHPSFVALHMTVYVPAVALTLIACHQLEAERQIAFLQMHENERLKHELSHRNEELQRLSVTDPLTLLPNRRGTAAMLSAMRAGEEADGLSRCALLILDIDHFKPFNDNYGHAAGDACLARVAAAMRREMTGMMHLGRHGGEEFIAILPASGPGFARYVAERLRAAVWMLDIPHEHTRDGKGRVTISIGIACGSAADDTAMARLVEDADRALYVAKATGRNGWQLAEARAETTSANKAA